MNRIILRKEQQREHDLRRALTLIRLLPDTKRYLIEIKEYRGTRSQAQNAYLWGVVYPTILSVGQLEGWTADDLHEYFLGEHFGWEVLEGLGRRRMKPLKRSSKLSTTEFADYIDFIHRKAAEMGIYIPSPNEEAA